MAIRIIAWQTIRYSSYFLLVMCLLSLLQTNVYHQRKVIPFSGEKWHNPYREIVIDNNPWLKGNFHAHGNSWGGLSNGSGSPEELAAVYLDSIGYDWAAVSNYQKISKIDSSRKLIKAYEHGVGLGKQHQLVLGDQKVNWFDFPFLQFLNQKQTVIHKLKSESNLVAIAHPKLRGAYSFEDVKYLTGYDCMEVLNHIGRSREHWDAALSAGLPVYLLSSDDTHDFQNLHKTGQNITVFKAPEPSEKGVMQALKNGEAYGVDLREGSRDFAERKSEIADLPKPLTYKIENDSLKVSFDKEFSYLKFIGQNGIIRKEVRQANEAVYALQNADTYVRLVAEFDQPESHLYFNPVFRFNENVPQNSLPTINQRQSRIYRMTILYLLCGLVFLIWRIEKPKKSKAGKSYPKIRWATS